MKKSFLLWWSILLIADQVSKHYLFDQALLNHYSLFQSALNTGISFSLNISYFIVIPLTIISLWIFYHYNKKRHISDLATMLLVSGTLWNLIDRVLYNGVRDFIVMFDWFIYNLADIYITIAAVLIFWKLFTGKDLKI
jgi:signal peptidase II